MAALGLMVSPSKGSNPCQQEGLGWGGCAEGVAWGWQMAGHMGMAQPHGEPGLFHGHGMRRRWPPWSMPPSATRKCAAPADRFRRRRRRAWSAAAVTVPHAVGLGLLAFAPLAADHSLAALALWSAALPGLLLTLAAPHCLGWCMRPLRWWQLLFAAVLATVHGAAPGLGLNARQVLAVTVRQWHWPLCSSGCWGIAPGVGGALSAHFGHMALRPGSGFPWCWGRCATALAAVHWAMSAPPGMPW